MSEVSVDDRGRMYLPKDVRTEYGDRFRIVKLEDGIKLIPLNKNPVQGLRESFSDSAEIDLSEMGRKTDRKARDEIKQDLE